MHDEFPESAYSVLKTLRSELPQHIGVTAKVRLPPTPADADAGKLGPKAGAPPTPEERIHRLIECGVDLITVHGRSRFENKVAVGAANWEAIRRCVAAARSYSGNEEYPIFANGGIEFHEDIHDCLQSTSASGVMSSESLLENPGLFCNIGRQPETARELLERQLSYADMYLDYATLFPSLPGSLGAQGGSFNVIRSHLFKFLHRYFEENPDLRWDLGTHGLNNIKAARSLVSEIRRRYDSIDEELLMAKSCSDVDSSWYRRHRNPNVKKSSAGDESSVAVSIEEKKRQAKERIKKMKEHREMKQSETLATYM